MNYITEGFTRALHIIASGDREVLDIMWLTLRVSIVSVLIAALAAVPLGFFIGITSFRGKGLVTAALQTLMSLPTVTVGLIVYAFLSRRGPLGPLGFLFTPKAIIIGEIILVLPIITALTCAAAQGIDASVRKTAYTLGASRPRAALSTLREGRFIIAAALVAGFGRALSEVGAAMMLGGNIKGVTRTMTTAIAFETGKGEFAFSMALGILLLFLAFAVTGLFHLLQRRF